MTDEADAAAAALRAIRAEQARTLSALRIDVRLVYAVWAVAWAISFLGLWAAARGTWPVAAAVVALVVIFALATGFSTWHSMRRLAGVRAGSPWQGMVYGWGWMLGCLVLVALGIRLAGADLPGSVTLVVMPAVGMLICGLQFLAVAALWGDRSQLVLGAGLLVVDGASLFVPVPHHLLFVAIALGIGLAICAVLAGRRDVPEA